MVTLQLIVGLVVLVVGAEAMVKGATRIAATMKISPLVIGLTVVAFGTSSPELAVSIMSSMSGKPDIALGNVIGSNIFNILFVLGISSLIIPLIVQQQLIRLDVPVMIILSVFVLLFGLNGVISVWEGLLLIAMGIGYTVFVIRLSRREHDKSVLDEYSEEYGERKSAESGRLWISVLLTVIGLVLLVLGSRWLVNASVILAQAMGMSDLVIGITIIAIGTSLPEVATSVVAAIRGERDIAVGNAVGSSIFNIVFILGIAATIGGGMQISGAALRLDIPVMIAVAVACLPFFFSGRRLERWEGVVFLFYYCAYTAYLIMASQDEAPLEIFTITIIWFTLPLTVLTLIILTIRELRRSKKRDNT
jgi:cation:H+ antiporter